MGLGSRAATCTPSAPASLGQCVAVCPLQPACLAWLCRKLARLAGSPRVAEVRRDGPSEGWGRTSWVCLFPLPSATTLRETHPYPLGPLMPAVPLSSSPVHTPASCGFLWCPSILLLMNLVKTELQNNVGKVLKEEQWNMRYLRPGNAPSSTQVDLLTQLTGTH